MTYRVRTGSVLVSRWESASVPNYGQGFCVDDLAGDSTDNTQEGEER